MAESVYNLTSNNINNQNQSSAVPKNCSKEDCCNKTDQVMEPLLLENYTPEQTPTTVTNILECFKRNKVAPSKNDLIVGFLYILMIECGFVHVDYKDSVKDCDFNYQRLLKHTRTLPETWKKNGTYRLDFVLRTIPQLLVCTIVCMSAADDLLINCFIKGVDSFSLLIDPLTYFTGTVEQGTKPLFQNLQHLARNFKSAIAFPAKLSIVRASRGVTPCLKDLPPEIQVKIMTYLKIEDVLSLARTCTVLCTAANCVSLWIELTDVEFRKKHVYKTTDELKFLYEIKYARELSKIMTKGPLA